MCFDVVNENTFWNKYLSKLFFLNSNWVTSRRNNGKQLSDLDMNSYQ